jgi:hypothetical protein
VDSTSSGRANSRSEKSEIGSQIESFCFEAMQESLTSHIRYLTSKREVAQLGRALGLGPRGRRFESCLPDHLNNAGVV